jgi:hypothetical protein
MLGRKPPLIGRHRPGEKGCYVLGMARLTPSQQTEPVTSRSGQTWFRYQPNPATLGADLGAPATSAQLPGADAQAPTAPRAPDPDPPAAVPAKPLTRRRQPPPRARISFEAPSRLKARLDRLARELDRSKTSLLRDGLSRYLVELAAKGGDT